MSEVPIAYLGKNVFDDSEVFFTMRDRDGKLVGNTIICAPPGYGKTILLKNIAVQAIGFKSLIIFDTMAVDGVSEWELIKHANFEKNNSDNKYDLAKGISNLNVISNISFSISDLNSEDDWISAGISHLGAKYVTLLAIRKDLHNNDPHEFRKILEDLPTKETHLDGFNSKYKTNFRTTIMVVTKQSLVPRVDFMVRSGYFASDEEILKGKVTYITDWKHAFDNQATLIKFDNVDLDKEKGMLYAGLILKKLEPYLFNLQPLIIFEEADRLAPERNYEIKPSSVEYMSKYVVKHEKKGVACFFIVQNPTQIYHVIYNNCYAHILGNISTEGTNKLHWDASLGVRQMRYSKKGFKDIIFNPTDSMTKLP